MAGTQSAGVKMLTAALEYAARGWPIFPCKPGLKTPLTKHGVLDATANPQQIEKWWTATPNANIGFHVGGADMLALDYDPGHNLEVLEQNVGPIPATRLRSSTPRGGEHCYFSIGHDEHVPASTSKLAPHVDVRSFNSYTLLPPSRTKDGPYEWIEDGKPAFRTERLLQATATGRSKSEDRDEWIIEPDLSENVALATKWLRETATIATETQGGDHLTYATAAMMKSYGISPETALELMQDHWNPDCKPPWEPEALQLKVENAYAYNTSPPGNMTPAYRAESMKALLAPIVTSELPSGDETNVAGFRFADREALKHVKPPEWILEDFIPEESYAMLFGAYSTFKTFLALDMALTVACENDPESTLWQADCRGPVLFMAGEGRASVAKRIKAWEQVHNNGQEVKDFVLVDPVPLINITEEKLQALIDEGLRRHPEGYFMTVVDTVGRSMAGADENAQQSASSFTALVDRLRKELGGSVLALHHTGHQEGKRARGSSLFGTDPDTVVRIDRAPNARVVSLTMTKQKDAPEWETKKHMKLNEVHLSPEITSLVAVKPAENECPKGDKFHPTEGEREAFMAVLNEAVIARLKCDKSKEWSQIALADAVATDERIEIGNSQLRQRHLKDLREDSSQPASRFYNAGKRKWRYGED